MSIIKTVKNLFTKSGYSPSSSSYGFCKITGLSYGCYDGINIESIIKSYITCSPVYDATNRITESILDIPSSLKEKDKQVFNYTHPFLELLNNPNPYQDGDEFMEEVYNSYLMFNNLFIHISGKGKPVELLVLKQQNISFQFDIKGYPSEITYSSNSAQRSYKFENGGFFDRMGSELIHLRGYNPLNENSTTGYFGVYRLTTF